MRGVRWCSLCSGLPLRRPEALSPALLDRWVSSSEPAGSDRWGSSSELAWHADGKGNKVSELGLRFSSLTFS